jgi:uncharacterized NAD(P)/FAD-binding protein YdhS
LTVKHVAVVGGGYTGTLQAIELLRSGLRVTLIEREPPFARGVAYGTSHPDHLLNVRAQAMSAFADAPSHFADWLESKGLGGPGDFAPRRTYGAYLGELLERFRSEAGERFRSLAAEAVDIRSTTEGETVELKGGGAVAADAVVLAVGNLAPETTRGIDPEALGGDVYVSDPWKEDVAAGLTDADTVLLIGTGLTAIDAALMLDSSGFAGRVLALSRRGLLPRAHSDAPMTVPAVDSSLQPRATALLRHVRRTAAGHGWRPAVDSLRPITQSLWEGAEAVERRRFLRHLRPWWDVHRHRIAPSIAARISRMQEQGRLDVAAGKILKTSLGGRYADVKFRPRGSSADVQLRVRRIVNCTGPQADISRAGEPLLDSLMSSGRIGPDVCRIGIDVDMECHTIGSEGASQTLFAVGPLTKSASWEIVAVPDIRQQVRALAERLSARS